VSRGTWDTARVPSDFGYAAITLYGRPFQIARLSLDNPTSRSRNPEHSTINNPDILNCMIINS
jgi:hypothetical protein